MSPSRSPVAIDIARFSAALALDNEPLATTLLAQLQADGVPREAVREAILQIYLFDGFPTALEGMRLLDAAWPGAPDPGEQGHVDQSAEWLRRGDELHRQIYGELAPRVLANTEALSPELAHWMILEGYGKVLSRPGLELGARELAVVAVLAVKNRPRQLHSHLRGALRVGCSAIEIRALLDALEEIPGIGGLSAARSLLERMAPSGDTGSR